MTTVFPDLSRASFAGQVWLQIGERLLALPLQRRERP